MGPDPKGLVPYERGSGHRNTERGDLLRTQEKMMPTCPGGRLRRTSLIHTWILGSSLLVWFSAFKCEKYLALLNINALISNNKQVSDTWKTLPTSVSFISKHWSLRSQMTRSWFNSQTTFKQQLWSSLANYNFCICSFTYYWAMLRKCPFSP